MSSAKGIENVEPHTSVFPLYVIHPLANNNTLSPIPQGSGNKPDHVNKNNAAQIL
jgi:hypothetical protein